MHEARELRSHPVGDRGATEGRGVRQPSGAPQRPELIITGDDLGLRDDWDAAIFEALDRGVLTSTSVVTNGPVYGAATRPLRDGGFDCGVHLNLLHGEPLSPAAEVPSLVDASGRFPGSVAAFLRRYMRGTVRRSEIALEWERQLRRACDDGLSPSHLNSHYHLHAFPSLFGLAVELARRFRIGWVRVPDEPPWHARGVGGRVRLGALWLLAQRNRRMRGTDGIGLMPCRGLAASGKMGLAAWCALLDRLGPETHAVEVSCHPGQADEENAALLSRDLAEKLQERVRPRSFRDLVPAPAPLRRLP